MFVNTASFVTIFDRTFVYSKFKTSLITFEVMFMTVNLEETWYCSLSCSYVY